MTLQDSLLLIKKRTKKENDDVWLVAEMNSALSFVWNRIYVAYPDLELTFETTATLAADTQQLDLGAAIAALGGEFFGHKTFYTYDSGSQRYIPVRFLDANHPDFLAREQETAELIFPSLASVVNFDQVRFAPALPSGTQYRSDWVGKPPNFSLNSQTQTTIPEPLQQAITDKATSQMYVGIDDDRVSYWEAQARDKIVTGIHAIKYRQQQTPQTTAPFPSRRRWSTGAYNSD